MGRFLLGFVIGAAIGAATVIVTAPRSGSALRQGIRGLLEDTADVAREAREERERELWREFRGRLSSSTEDQAST